jgi:catechol 2,3-dioxygenase-like lactoylglutathione lyase family enzyme
MIRHIAGIAEVVDDLDAACTFYSELGLEVVRDENANYARVEVSGVLHFGLWPREDAAESTYGSRDAVDRVPLGFTLAFEVDEVDVDRERLGVTVVRGAHDEPWGQRTLRFRSPSGALCEISETSWARQLEQNVKAKTPEGVAT